ncbi:MAG: deoxyribodipyrimidine photo-lyase, partial [Verrucomicrobiota bacterium]|nr:deoxyribodipyrimidine photo-lyase [Verrucomicrobiota bacterium]
MSAVERTRIVRLNNREIARGGYVLYWMQQSQRAVFNHALEYAVSRSNERKQPLLVCFGLTDGYPEANLRHYTFMLEGLHDVGVALKKRGVGFVLQHGDPAEVARRLGQDASL